MNENQSAQEAPNREPVLIGPDARTLSECFNESAYVAPCDCNPLSMAADFYRERTGGDIPKFNMFEIEYLKEKLLETARLTLARRKETGVETEHEAQRLFTIAREMHLIRSVDDQEGVPSYVRCPSCSA